MPHFADALLDAIRRKGSPVCVGLDPVHESLPEEVRARHHDPLGAMAEFCRGVLRAAAPRVPAIKFQSACFERYGSKGVALLEQEVAQAASLGLLVVLDFKRGDIGVSSAHYAAAARRTGAHAVTVSGYLGVSGVTPFLESGLGVFVLVRTSNPDSDAIQQARLADGRSVAELMADVVASLGAGHVGSGGLSSVGAVVGATQSAHAAALRARMPNQPFLVPGYGAQGGKAEDLRAMLRPDRTGVLVTASRSVIYAAGPGAWDDRVAAAAEAFSSEVGAVVAG
jgi:orotidine-5'-phosphate decarboxylase